MEPTLERVPEAKAFDVMAPIEEIGRRMREQLRGGTNRDQVVWQKDRQRLLIHAGSLAVRGLDGWLLANLEVESDETRRQLLQFVFYVGRGGQNDGTQAACGINAATEPAAHLIEPWGRDLQRVLWDGVLDAIEASVARVATQLGERPVTLAGFFAEAGTFHVSVLPGEL
jgi:hypothetical protein